jgi:hypothetical protein
MIDWRKYFIVFLITFSLFLTAGYLANYFSNEKIDQLKSIQDDIAINILSSETEFALLQDSSCESVSDSVLSAELDELGRKLEWGQANLGASEEVSYLKKYYSLLQIKDYILMKKISERCEIKSAFILYFYTTKDVCSECARESIVLSALRRQYPQLRVYSFDYGIDLSAVKAMIQIYGVKDTELPALVLDDELLTGFHSVEDLEPRLKEAFGFEDEEEIEEEILEEDVNPQIAP